MRALRALAILAAIGLAVGLWITRAVPLPDDELAGITGDAAHGAYLFAAGGCASCHTAPDSESGADSEIGPVLSGGRLFPTAFGTFIAPNISPDPVAGIGAWSDLEIASALQRGVSPDGAHLFPAFPFTTYIRATPQDIADLIAYMRTLPASDIASLPHDVGFPFNVRRGVGLWKILYLTPGWVLADAATPQIERGRYLVEALGHCGECHTPRNALGGLDRGSWLGGAPHPTQARSRIPNITPGGIDWSEADIAEYLKTGFTPDFDSAGGEMAAVVRNMAQLTDEDRAAIAAYLKAVPPITSEPAPAATGG